MDAFSSYVAKNIEVCKRLAAEARDGKGKTYWVGETQMAQEALETYRAGIESGQSNENIIQMLEALGLDDYAEALRSRDYSLLEMGQESRQELKLSLSPELYQALKDWSERWDTTMEGAATTAIQQMLTSFS